MGIRDILIGGYNFSSRVPFGPVPPPAEAREAFGREALSRLRKEQEFSQGLPLQQELQLEFIQE